MLEERGAATGGDTAGGRSAGERPPYPADHVRARSKMASVNLLPDGSRTPRARRRGLPLCVRQLLSIRHRDWGRDQEADARYDDVFTEFVDHNPSKRDLMELVDKIPLTADVPSGDAQRVRPRPAKRVVASVGVSVAVVSSLGGFVLKARTATRQVEQPGEPTPNSCTPTTGTTPPATRSTRIVMISSGSAVAGPARRSRKEIVDLVRRARRNTPPYFRSHERRDRNYGRGRWRGIVRPQALSLS